MPDPDVVITRGKLTGYEDTPKPVTKRVKDGYRGTPTLNMSSYSSAWLWDGQPKYQTGALYGH